MLDQLEPDRDVENFVTDYGTGNTISDPQTFTPYNAQDSSANNPPAPSSRPAEFVRVSRRAAPSYQTPPNDHYHREDAPPEEPAPVARQPEVNGHGSPQSQSAQAWHEPSSPQAAARHSPTTQQHPHNHPTRGRDDSPATSNRSQQPPTGPPSIPPPPAPEPYVAPPAVSRSSSPRRQQRVSQPLPTPGHQYRHQDHPPMPTPPPPPPPTEETGGILFYGA